MNRIYGATILLTILFVQNVISSSSNSSSEENEEADMEIMSCKNETGASDMDVARLINRANPLTQSAKCLTACYLEEKGLISNGKLRGDNLLDFVDDETLVGSSGKTLDKIIKEIAEECKAITDANNCEAAAKILVCLNSAVRKRGFCPNVF